MVAKQYFNQELESVLQQEGSCSDHLQDNFDEAAEETLSLCDLAVNGNSEDYWNDGEFSKRRSASDEQDFFEFFSEDFTAASTNYPKDDIIFCGKLIPYKEAAAVQEQTQKINTPKNTKSRLFSWKSNSFNKFRSASSKPQQQEKSTYSYKSLSQNNNGYEKFTYKYDFSVKKVSSSTKAAAAAYVKPRWYLFAFGYGRFSPEMELRNMKSRQSRRIPAATMFRLDGGGETIKKRSETQKRSSWKCLRTLLRVLGCKNRQANVVAEASFGLHSICVK